jgi:hypothetical protein
MRNKVEEPPRTFSATGPEGSSPRPGRHPPAVRCVAKTAKHATPKAVKAHSRSATRGV